LGLKKYINNVSALQFFQLFRFGILFLISICFAKSHLNIEEIGIYEKLIFLSGAVSFFWVNGLIQSLLPLYNNTESAVNTKKSPLLFNSLLISILFSVTTALILIITEKNTASFLLSANEIPYKWLFITFFIISTPSFLLEYVYLLLKKPQSIILYSTLTFSLQFLLVVVPIWLGYGIRESLYGLIVVSALRFIWLIILVLNNSESRFSWSFFKEHLILAAPLIAAALISGSMTYIDGIIVSNQFDNATFAIYRYGARELPLAMLLANAFGNAMIPEFSIKENIETSLKSLKEKSLKLMHFLFPLSIILIIISRWLFTIFFNPKFIDGASVFNVFLLLVISRLIFPQTILIGLKRTNAMLIVSIIELIIKLIFSIWLVMYFSIVGVALGTFIAFMAERIILVFYNYKFLKIKPSKYIDFKWYISYSIIILAVYFFVEKNIYGI
jgi:O-antigen/teichoic acid export membrane protein